jgi:hypothetical protein
MVGGGKTRLHQQCSESAGLSMVCCCSDSGGSDTLSMGAHCKGKGCVGGGTALSMACCNCSSGGGAALILLLLVTN